MKALIISDLHSNIDALEAIWAKEKDSDAIYCAGDVVDVGLNPCEVIDWMKAHKVQCVKGNHDELVVNLYKNKESILAKNNRDLTWLEHNALAVAPAEIAYLDALPENMAFTVDGFEYFMRHAYDEYKMIESKFQFNCFFQTLGIAQTTRLILGHTHKQCLFQFSENQLLLNPGSTGYRSYLEVDDKNTEAEYMIIQDGQIKLCSIDYDKKRLRDEIEKLKDCLREKDYLKMMRRAQDSIKNGVCL